MSQVSFEGVSRRFVGADRPAVDNLDLRVEDGEFLVLVGPSGCGKSTSLRILAGLEVADGGRITIGSKDVTHLPPKSRDIAMVFQSYALYPHMTVAANMGFALKMSGVRKSDITSRVAGAAKMLDIEDLLDRKPKLLSGGQRQRVAMGRAIVRSPEVFLMDEPLSNLDAKLRVQTRTQIAQLQRQLGTTMVYVTHDQVEAMTMGDRVAVMRDGVLQQCATPREIYDRPSNVFVAGFLGTPAMNILELSIVDGAVQFGEHSIPIPRDVLLANNHPTIIVGIRPEDLHFYSSGTRMVVDVVEELGADAYVYGQVHMGGADHSVIVRGDWRNPPVKGQPAYIGRIDASHVHLFSPVTELRLN
jgi:multiple sugar transport system ATP-binding protein